jgi:hypothetical protein
MQNRVNGFGILFPTRAQSQTKCLSRRREIHVYGLFKCAKMRLARSGMLQLRAAEQAGVARNLSRDIRQSRVVSFVNSAIENDQNWLF